MEIAHSDLSHCSLAHQHSADNFACFLLSLSLFSLNGEMILNRENAVHFLSRNDMQVCVISVIICIRGVTSSQHKFMGTLVHSNCNTIKIIIIILHSFTICVLGHAHKKKPKRRQQNVKFHWKWHFFWRDFFWQLYRTVSERVSSLLIIYGATTCYAQSNSTEEIYILFHLHPSIQPNHCPIKQTNKQKQILF